MDDRNADSTPLSLSVQSNLPRDSSVAARALKIQINAYCSFITGRSQESMHVTPCDSLDNHQTKYRMVGRADEWLTHWLHTLNRFFLQAGVVRTARSPASHSLAAAPVVSASHPKRPQPSSPSETAVFCLLNNQFFHFSTSPRQPTQESSMISQKSAQAVAKQGKLA